MERDADADVLTCSIAHGLVVGDSVSFGPGSGVFPGGIAAEPEYYYVIAVPTTTTLQISLTRSGSSVDITSVGAEGWTIHKAHTPVAQNIDFALYTEIDIYGFLSLIPRATDGGAYAALVFAPETCRVALNDANVRGADFNALLYSSQTTKKYVNLVMHINIRKITTALYVLQVDIAGLQSDNISLSGATAYTRIFTGKVTGADITRLTITSGYIEALKNGARIVMVRR